MRGGTTRMLGWASRRIAAIVGAAAALLGGTAVAVAQLGGSGGADPQQRPNGVITAVQADQAASFAVLRGDAGTAADLTRAAADVIDVGIGPDVGASAALARSAGTGVDGAERYVVPGDGWMCVVSGDGGASCNRTTEVVRGYGLAARRDGDATILEGLVPDGVATVDVTGASGAVAHVTPAANVWTASVTFTPQAVHWTGTDGAAHVVPVGTTPEGNVGPPLGG